ncbi:MAG: BLUF domain-containing protein [Synechococcaceae cyanobacterium SM1_2_3]|nr:BLUF domain-containing protein [Synechococcaceae cyanobacterium SM1_2_3]
MKLHRLIYVSDQREYIEFTDLKEIMAKSETNNAELEITGLLLMIGQKFLQVLEGSAAEVNSLYERILRDSRHKKIKLISYTPIHDRHFKDWSMKGINWSSIKPDIQSFLYKKYGQSEKVVTVPEDPWLAFSLLYDVYCNIHHGDGNK